MSQTQSNTTPAPAQLHEHSTPMNIDALEYVIDLNPQELLLAPEAN